LKTLDISFTQGDTEMSSLVINMRQKELDPILSKGARYVLTINTLDYLYWSKLLKHFLSQPESILSKYLHESELQMESKNRIKIIEQLQTQYLQCKTNDLKLFLSPVSAKLLFLLLYTYKDIYGEDNPFIRVRTERYLDRLSPVKDDLNRWIVFSSK
jgi:hypothetical protein